MNLGASKKTIELLRAGGADGVSPTILSEQLYGRNDEIGNVAQIVQHLRKRGYAIDTRIIYSGRKRESRYVLLEAAKIAIVSRPADVPSPRENPDPDTKRGAR